MLKSKLFNSLIEPVITFVMPALCTSCKCTLPPGRRVICDQCFSKLPALPDNYISVLKNEIEDSWFKNLFIVYQFSESFQNLIHLFKYQRYVTLAKYFAEAINKRFALNNYDLVTSVPLNPVKEKERGYNQSALLANELGKLAKIPVNNGLIKRVKNTVSQTKLNKEERIKNVDTAFESNADLSMAKILIVDDVITTGSTLNACAKVLFKNQAALVDVVALATPMDYLQQELERSK